MPQNNQLCSKSIKICKTGSLKPKIKEQVRKGLSRNRRSESKRSRFKMDVSNTSETIWLTCPSKQAKLPSEKIYLRTSVSIKKLTKRDIDDTCLGRWRCDSCEKIENSHYLLQLHISTNCETGLSFNCEICDTEINNFADFAVHHIEHEASTKKECPICLCPNVNNIKEHLIVKGHVLMEINGFKFTDNNQKREPAVSTNSNTDGCSQDFIDQDGGPDVKDSVLSCGPQLSVIDSMPDFKMEHDFALHPAEALSEQSITTRMIVKDLVDQDGDRDVKDSILPPGSQSTESVPDFKIEHDFALHHPGALPEQSVTTTAIVDDLEDKNPSSNEDSISLDANEFFLSHGPQLSRTDLVLDFEAKSDNAVQIPKAYPHQSISVTPIVEDSEVDTLNSVKTQNMDVNSASVSMDTILPLFPNQSKQENQNQEIGPKDLDEQCIPQKHVQREFLSIAQSLSPVQERLNLRRRKTKNIYYESSDSDLDNSGNEVIKEKADESDGNYEVDSKGFQTSEIVSASGKESYVCSYREYGEGENKVFICGFCGKILKTKGHLKEHINTHTKEKVHICTYCGKNFVRRSHLLDHERLHTNDRPFTCEFCGKTFRSSSQLNIHSRFHRRDKLYICEICGKRFVTSSSLKRHLKIHERYASNSPTEANLITAVDNDDGTSTHAVEESEVINENGMDKKKAFQCQICKKYFPTEYALRIHTKIHSKVYYCSLCPKSFTSKHKVLTHEKVHVGVVVFECPICKKTFQDKSSLIDHKRIHKGERSFQCDICTRSFTKKSTLVTHMRIHSGERPFECQTCKKTFTTSSWLKAHERSHTGENPFMCSLCEKQFTTRSALKVHMRSHTGACPFVCNYCGKAFTTSSSFRVHERNHSGVTPFKCRICKRAFTASGALKWHQKSHAADFTHFFLCRFCDESFKTLDDLKKHELTHQHKKRYHCKNCEEAFITMFELTCHIRADHGTK